MTFSFPEVLILLAVVGVLLRVRSFNVNFSEEPKLKPEGVRSDAIDSFAGARGLERAFIQMLAQYSQAQARPERLLTSESSSGKRPRAGAKRKSGRAR